MIKRGNKKADTNMLWIVIGLILILIVVAMILFFFGKGTFNLSDIFGNLFRSENIDTVRSACQIACSTASTNDWCGTQRQITFKATRDYTYNNKNLVKKGDLLSTSITCEDWANGDFGEMTEEEIKSKQNSTIFEANSILSGKLTSCGSITCP
jgi:hypothetical protein